MKRRDPLFWLGVGYLVVLVLFAVVYPLVGPAYDQIGAQPHAMPSTRHPLGTDDLGRDILVRIAYGARLSLLIGLVVQGIALGVGILVGVLGVYGSPWLRNPLLRFTDGMFAFPDILLAVLIIAVRGPSKEAVIVALSITAWPSIARLVVTQLASLKDREFVVAARAMGASTFYVVTRHVLPQLWGILLAVSMIDLAATILAESTLSFLGIGVQPPEPTWGSMIDIARQKMNAHPVPLIWPCLFLSVTIFMLNFVGDGLRSRLDPRSR